MRVPSIEDMTIKLIDEGVMIEALQWVTGCEGCARNAVTSFEYLLDATTNADPATTQYVMCRPARCPRCRGKITEKTHVAI